MIKFSGHKSAAAQKLNLDIKKSWSCLLGACYSSISLCMLLKVYCYLYLVVWWFARVFREEIDLIFDLQCTVWAAVPLLFCRTTVSWCSYLFHSCSSNDVSLLVKSYKGLSGNCFTSMYRWTPLPSNHFVLDSSYRGNICVNSLRPVRKPSRTLSNPR